MSYFQSDIYFKLISSIQSSGNLKLINSSFIVIQIGSANIIKNFFSCRNLINDPFLIKNSNSIFAYKIKNIAESINNNKAIFTEFRFHRELPDGFLKTDLSGIKRFNYYNILLNTDKQENVLFKALSLSKKRQVKSTLKNNIKVIKATVEAEVVDFYNILQYHYKNKVKKPIYPLELFLNFFKNKENGYIFIAKDNEKVIGGMLAPVYHNEVIYEWYIAALDEEYKGKGIYPSVLLTWEAIRFASENGFQYFDFMGAGPVEKEYGVRRFKMQFGGELVKTARIRIIHKPLLYKIGKLALDFGLGKHF